MVKGTPATGLAFYHADGTPYGAVASLEPERAAVLADVHSAMRNLGHSEREARQAVDAVRQGTQGRVLGLEQAVRMAIAALRQPSRVVNPSAA